MTTLESSADALALEGSGLKFYLSVLDKGVRSEKAFKLALAEMHVQGVSTRNVAVVVEQLCGASVSSTQVSHCAAQLDVGLEACAIVRWVFIPTSCWMPAMNQIRAWACQRRVLRCQTRVLRGQGKVFLCQGPEMPCWWADVGCQRIEVARQPAGCHRTASARYFRCAQLCHSIFFALRKAASFQFVVARFIASASESGIRPS